MNGTGIDEYPAPRLVVVTGAGGFIGRHLVRALADAGYRVRAVTRAPSQPDRGAIWATADVTGVTSVTDSARGSVRCVPHPGVAPEANWLPALAGADAIVHLAGLAHLAVDTREMRGRLRAVNVQSTQRLATAAAGSGVRDFIFMSSIKAVADHSGAKALAEDAVPLPEDCYGLAKLAAERRLGRLRTTAPAPAMRIVVLRPPLVYGPGVGANFAALLGLVGRGLPLPLAGVRNRRSLLYVGNLTAAVLRCLERRDVDSGTFHLSDGEAVSTPELVRAIAHAQGRRARLVGLPVGLLALAARAAGRREQASRLLGSLEVDNGLFCRAFDWRPPFTLAQGLQATV